MDGVELTGVDNVFRAELGFDAEILVRLRHYRRDKKMFRVCSLLLAIPIALSMTLGCGTTHATIRISAPSTATAGTPFTITVTTIYRGSRDTIINSVIHFSSSDTSAVLPPDYLFASADAGSHTWPDGVTLKTPGSQTITATIIMATGINGSVNVVVAGPSFSE